MMGAKSDDGVQWFVFWCFRNWVRSGGIPLDFCVWVFSESMCSSYVSVQVYVLVCVGRE